MNKIDQKENTIYIIGRNSFFRAVTSTSPLNLTSVKSSLYNESKQGNKIKGEMSMKKVLIEKTKKGYPAMWESGGGYRNTGEATIIANKDGQPKKAVYVRRRGQLANSHHALFIIEVGDYIVEADHHRYDFYIEISKILGFDDKEEEAVAIVEQVNCFSNGEWDTELPDFLEAAVQAAKEKAICYHCRSPHYITE
jgi:hypothetical protein